MTVAWTRLRNETEIRTDANVNAKSQIPSVVAFSVVSLLVVAELILGTDPAFVAMMAVTLFCIAITYNLLGGMETFSGLIYSMFALRTIVLSQFVKVLLLEAADKNLEAPQLTIAVYMVFFFSAMIGVYAIGPLRINLPRPIELTGESQKNALYLVSFVLGLLADLAFQASMGPGDENQGLKSFGLAFSGLLTFSLVLAVDQRVKSTNGQHSLSPKVLFPAVFLVLFGHFDTSRSAIMTPGIAYFATCYFRGFQFKRRHYLVVALGLAAFILVVSPFELYFRGVLADKSIVDKIYLSTHILETTPNWAVVKAATALGDAESTTRESYFSRPGTGVFSRFSLIRSDSNMINACASGFHYGWTSIQADILLSVPSFLYRNKPADSSSAYTGRVTGLNGDNIENSSIVLSCIGDSFGSFGWMGVVLYPILIFPLLFLIVDNIFDIRQPWGTVAVGIFLGKFPEATAGTDIMLMIRIPILILLLSYLMAGIMRMIPMRGDHAAPALRAGTSSER
jgi:hypothetical protein